MRPIDADDLVKKIYEHAWVADNIFIDELVDGIIGNMETIETEAIIDVLQEIRAEIETSMESIVGKYNGDTPERQRPSAKIERNEGRKQCLEIIERKMRKLKDGEKEPCEDWYDIPSEEMTLEQARQAVNDLRKKLAENLEQEPTAKNDLGVDCISRDSAIKALGYDIRSFEFKSGVSKHMDDIAKLLNTIYEIQVNNINALPSVTPQEPGWIPVSERLPEDKEIILITSSDMYLSKLNPWCGWKNRNNWYTFTANGSYLIKYPIAWMPLPKPYKAESEG